MSFLLLVPIYYDINIELLIEKDTFLLIDTTKTPFFSYKKNYLKKLMEFIFMHSFEILVSITPARCRSRFHIERVSCKRSSQSLDFENRRETTIKQWISLDLLMVFLS